MPKLSPLQPDVSTLSKLGSIVRHAQEYHSPHGHQFDLDALKQLLDDPEIADWCRAMDEMALLPKLRNPS